MKRHGTTGFTLVELVITLTVMGIIAGITTGCVRNFLKTHRYGTDKSKLYTEALIAMERMTGGVRSCSFLLIPNAHFKTREILAFSGNINDDGDFYFNDSLFPRVDEDLSYDMNEDWRSGISNIDDDGDGYVDEDYKYYGADDDEDGYADEDPIDGIDNDKDGNIDEDCDGDSNNDGAPGVIGIDDDNDGLVDEGDSSDDDEDGSLGETGLWPTVYSFERKSGTLWASFPYRGDSIPLSTNVIHFAVDYLAPEKIMIDLRLAGDDADTVRLSEVVSPRNVLQKLGKRVR